MNPWTQPVMLLLYVVAAIGIVAVASAWYFALRPGDVPPDPQHPGLSPTEWLKLPKSRVTLSFGMSDAIGWDSPRGQAQELYNGIASKLLEADPKVSFMNLGTAVIRIDAITALRIHQL